MSKYLTAPVPSTRMPSGIPYIIGNEAAERFSFYGMKAMLVVFMTQYLTSASGQPNPMEPSEARQAMALFTASAYFFPILGAIVADALLGKYMTIMLLSMVYCIGHGALALMDMPPAALEATLEPRTWLFIGLALIAIGSGGIKPCVSAHVGDQFGESNKTLLGRVYGWFYFSINFGSLISTLLTPWVLARSGPDVIIAGPGWAFGIPGILMAIATFCFWLGRHKFVHIQPQGLNFVRQTFFSREGLGVIAKLVPIYLFVAFFWALYDQTGSAWVQQAETMDRRFMGVLWLESQVQAINPLLILMFIPLFTYLIYPLINRVFTLTSVRKICIGFFITIAAFALVSWVEQKIVDAQTAFRPTVVTAFADGSIELGPTMKAAVERGHGGAADEILRLGGSPLLFYSNGALINAKSNCTDQALTVALRGPKGESHAAVPAGASTGRLRQFIQEAELPAQPGAEAKPTGISVLVFDGTSNDGLLRAVAGSPFEPLVRGGANLASVVAAIDAFDPTKDGWTRAQLGMLKATLLGGLVFVGDELGGSASISVTVTRADGTVMPGSDLWSEREGSTATGVGLERAAGPVLVNAVVEGAVMVRATQTEESGVPNIAWQLLAFIIITAAEVMVSITCLEFSYTQAPRQMKSFVMGLFLLSVSAGNGIIYFVNRFTTDAQTGVSSLEGPSYYWFFTWLMVAASIGFLVVAKLYKPREYLQEEKSVAEQRALGDGAALGS